MKITNLLLITCGLILSACTSSPPLIVLDSGHNPEQAGAVSLRGIDEIQYNDRFTAELSKALTQAGYSVVLTRTVAQSIALKDRAALANRLAADLFLSIHHDSAQLHYLYPIQINGKQAYRSVQPLQGSSILVSQLNPEFEQSYRFAELLGQQLAKLNRQAAWHHSGNMIGNNHPLLNEKYGIYQYDKLVVLRTTKVPAVLFEVGVIVDAEDEAYVENQIHRQQIIRAIVQAVQQFLVKK